jgi:hypothetical protein
MHSERKHRGLAAPAEPGELAAAALETWYRSSLRPKLARAARRGVIAPAQAAQTDLLVGRLLQRPPSAADRRRRGG